MSARVFREAVRQTRKRTRGLRRNKGGESHQNKGDRDSGQGTGKDFTHMSSEQIQVVLTVVGHFNRGENGSITLADVDLFLSPGVMQSMPPEMALDVSSTVLSAAPGKLRLHERSLTAQRVREQFEAQKHDNTESQPAQGDSTT